MKRKYFSVLLMAAMTVASTSVMTSCKDYDDDINALRTEITNNATTLTSLVTEKVNNLTTELSNLKSQQATLEKALESAQSNLEAAIKKAETDSKAYADVQAAAAQKAAIEAAKANLDDAVKTINEAIAAANKRVDDVNSKADDNATKIAGLLKADGELQDAINQVKADAEVAANKALEAAQAAQKTADENKTALDQLADNLTKVKSDLEKSISVLGEKVDKNITDIAANKADADSKFETVNSLIRTNQQAIEALKNADAELLQKIQKNQADLEGLARTVAANKVACDLNLENAKAYTDAQVAALIKGIGANAEEANATIVKALAQIAANKDAIGDIEKLSVGEAKDLVSAVNANATTLGSAVADLAVLDAKLGNYITSNDLEISKIKDAASQLADKVAKNTQDISDLKAALDDVKAKYVKTADFTTETQRLQGLINDLQEKCSEITGETGYVKSLQTQINNLKTTLENHTVDFTTLKNQVTADIQGIYGQLQENSQIMTQMLNFIQDQIDVLTALSHQLKSLVFGPSEYYQGIEAIGVWSYNYNAIKNLPAYDAEKNQIAANSEFVTANAKTSVVPDVTATYYLNPSNATVDEDVNHYKFIVQNAAYTRAAKGSDITIKSVKAEDGKALVTFSMQNADNIAKIPLRGDGKVDVAALRYTYKSETTKNDTTITSDWAALKQYVVKDFIINKAKAAGQTEEANENHLANTAAAAISHSETGAYYYPTLEIQYDDKKGIDLDKWINVHYNTNGNADKLWGGQTTVNKKGFKLAYSLVGYIAPGHATNESAHAKISGTTLTVNGYKEETGRQIIGRTPLVRVTLVDENTNKQVAAVGYIVVKITDKEIVPVEATADPIDNGYTVKCNPGTALNGVQAITWEEVENKVCGKLGVSKEEFEANWTFDSENQYKKNNQGKFVVADNFGTVVKTTGDQLGHQTNVLTWTVDNATAYTYFVTEKNTTKSIWVKFTPNKTTDTPIYVELTWTPTAINKTPEASILNSSEHKKTAAWHKANTNTKGWDQLHIQVGNATDPKATCEYENLVIANTFNKSVLAIVKEGLGTTYSELANKASVTFTFAPVAEQTHKDYVGVSGKNYKVTVNAAGTEIYANNTLLATITTGNGTIDVAKNDVSKDILNEYANLADLTNALTLTVKANVKTCEPAADLINLKNNKFDVKVIKPLFVEGTTIKGMQLNNFKSLTQTVKFDFKDFNGYTQEDFFKYSNKSKTFFSFYGIKSIKQVGNIMTDYSGARKVIDTNDIKVTYTEPSKLDLIPSFSGVVSKMGSIKLTQVNQSRANGFNVWVPIEIEYNWGTLKTEVKLEVQAAPAAAAKKH